MDAQDWSNAEAGIRRWLTANIGADIAAFDVMPGWRPAWNVTVNTASGPLHLHVRGNRLAGQEITPLHQEYRVFKLFEAEGIPVPKIYGWCDEPEAIVMQRVDNIPYHGGADQDPKLHALVAEYMGIMARVHKIDLTHARAAGLPIPATPADTEFAYYKGHEEAYLASKTGPEPMVELVRRWILDHAPLYRTEQALLIGDAPQFFHDGEHVTHIFDLELVHVGDPIADLVSVWGRDINEPIGGLTEILLRYVAESGNTIDWPTFDFHALIYHIGAAMRVRPLLKGEAILPAYTEYLSWDLSCSRAMLETFARMLDIELEPVPTIAPTPSDNAIALKNLVAACRELPPAGGRMREQPALSLANYLQRVDEIGTEIERLTLADISQFLDRSFATLAEAEAELEKFVIEHGALHRPALTRLFHRQIGRRLQLIQDYPAPIVARRPFVIDRSQFAS
ncbi:MAG: hypothetical protein JWM78_1684 [Verrucomicrobiaceae bacterium]|nr:hypothetical protein [Verrucomicrobiaceae bacterium]